MPVSDINKAAAYYNPQLGFRLDWTRSQSHGVCTSSMPQIQTATCFVSSMIFRLRKTTRMPNNRPGPVGLGNGACAGAPLIEEMFTAQYSQSKDSFWSFGEPL